MKILYIIESLRSGGKERRLISLIKELLLKENFTLEIIILSNNIHYKEIYNLNINIHFLKRNVKKDLRIISKFNSILNKFKPDIVHCWDNIAAIHFGSVCKFKRIPFINSMISTAPLKLSVFSKNYLVYAISYPFSDIILTNSKAGLNSFRVPVKKGRFIYNGFDFNRIKVKKSKELVKKELNIESERIIGMTASFSDKKDYITFVEAGKKTIDKYNDVIFIAVGGGENLEKIKDSVGDKYISNFRFLGRQNDVESIVNIFDIGVLATFTEGISNAIMEYMIFEKPVIATDGGGTNELVIDNKTGFLVEQQNVKQLVDKIEYLLENSKTASDFGENGKARIEKYFSINAMIEKTIELYKENINK